MDPKEKALAILRLDPGQAAASIDALTEDQRLDLVLSLPGGKQRMDLILASSRPEELTRAVPPEDLVLSIKDIGDADAVPFVEMSSDRQLTYLLDLELWVREGMDLGRLMHWLEILFECGKARVLRWVRSVDFELLVLLLERTVLLMEPGELENLSDRLSGRLYTPDNTHYLLIKLGADYNLLRQMLDLIFAKDPEMFFALTGNLGTNPPAELEELAYRWRTGRLADRGWPDLDEAMQIYQPAEPDGVGPRDLLPAGFEQPPRYPLQPRYTGKLLQAGVEKTEAGQQGLVAVQLANLINRVIISDGMTPGEAESLGRAGERVRGRLEIGLALLGACQADASARLLTGVPLVEVFRVGQGAINRRVQRARQIMARPSASLLDSLPAPLPDCLKALLSSRPLFVSLNEMLPREFADPADLAMLDQDLDLVEAAVALGDALGLRRSQLADGFPPGSHPESPEGLTFYTLLVTGFARSLLGLETATKPLDFDLLPRLFDQLPREQDALYQKIHDWAMAQADAPPPGLNRLIAGLAQLVWQQILVHRPEELDPRFIEGLWLKK